MDEITSEALQHEGYRATEGRYLELVAIINDQPDHGAELARAAGSEGTDQEPGLRRFGQWLSEAIVGTIS
jgi:hypothetical protein